MNFVIQIGDGNKFRLQKYPHMKRGRKTLSGNPRIKSTVFCVRFPDNDARRLERQAADRRMSEVELIRHHTTNGLNTTDQSAQTIPLPGIVQQPNLPLLTMKIGKQIGKLLSKEFDKPIAITDVEEPVKGAKEKR